MSERQHFGLSGGSQWPCDNSEAFRSVSDGSQTTAISVLAPNVRSRDGVDTPYEPEYFTDLFLDQVFKAINGHHGEYELAPVFYDASADIDTIAFRQEVFRDLERADLRAVVSSFAAEMSRMWAALVRADSLSDLNQRLGWFLEAAVVYCDAVEILAHELAHARPQSRGLSRFCEYLGTYVGAQTFRDLVADTRHLKAELATVRYSVEVTELTIRVRKSSPTPDYSAQIVETFERFKEAREEHHRGAPDSAPELNSVEQRILGLVAQLFSDVFSDLGEYAVRRRDYLDGVIERFDREVCFYLRYLGYIAPLKAAGLRFCYPELSSTSRNILIEEAFDLPLASSMVRRNQRVVCNDFSLTDNERIAIVTGPNQGGKTTFVRMIGQIHHLASLGCPVPGTKVQLYRLDRLFTHFGRAENDLSSIGRLEDDLVRMQRILSAANADSILIVNEAFSSTSLEDAHFLLAKTVARAIDVGFLCVMVTFVDGLAELNATAVSMVAEVDSKDRLVRTFKFVRGAADGRAHALALAERHGLTRALLAAKINR